MTREQAAAMSIHPDHVRYGCDVSRKRVGKLAAAHVQDDATGFIRLNALRLKATARTGKGS